MAAQNIDLSAFSLSDLRALSAKVSGEIADRAENAKRSLLSEFESKAKENGFSLSDILAASSEKKAGKKAAKTASVPAKYRNPKNTLETWTGRGRMPAWVKAFKEAGGDLESCRIESAA